MSFYDSIKSSIKGNQRYICSPEYHDAYRALRCKYLHFSTNQQLLSIADNRLVNPPSISTALKTSRSVIMRQVYSGDGSGGQKYLYDYDGESNTEMITVKCDVQTGEKFCVTPKIKMNERRS